MQENGFETGGIYQEIVLPKGVKANPASFMCCIPKGRPMIVMQNSRPKIKWVRQIQMPPKSIQITFIIIERQPLLELPLSVIFVPKGQSATLASLSVCSPKGMPMMVMIRSKLATRYSSATKSPPKTSQIILPRNENIFN